MIGKTKTFFIINGPVWIIFCLANLIFYLFISNILAQELWLKIGLGILCWQLICSGIMLLIDYPRKLKILIRLTSNSNTIKNYQRFLQPLRQTICGIFLAWAVKYNIKRDQHTNIEGR
ncbi:MAG: hypothetical protein K9N40_12050 [Candidatus Cloacimonetes bacterium]|nr:hypothetical protein [Candidatus Cloacimonadota bacterium]